MENNKYIKPQIEVITFETEGVIANSPTPGLSGTYLNTDARSRRRSLWNEE